MLTSRQKRNKTGKKSTAIILSVVLLVMSCLLYTSGPGTDPQSIRFPGRINICQYHFVGKGKGLGKFGKEGFGSCIGMRLENAPKGLVGIISCLLYTSGQC